MFFFGKEYESIDVYITSMFVKNGTSFILFYMKYKPLFSLEFQTIFNKYLVHYLSGKYIQFNGMRHLIKVLHNRLLLQNINDENTCTPLKPIKTNTIHKRNISETKYRSNSEMLEGLKYKFDNTIHYKFTSNTILYRIDNIIKQKYDIHSSDLFKFIIQITMSLSKKHKNHLSTFINNFLKTLIKSQLYRNTEKLKLFLLFYNIFLKENKNRDILNIHKLLIYNKQVIPYTNENSEETLFYNLLINSDDIHCHDFYKFMCNEYIRQIPLSASSTSSIDPLHDTIVIQNNTYKNYKNTNVFIPFKELFDEWVNSIIQYETIHIANPNAQNVHNHKFMKSLYYLLIYMLHHTKSTELKRHLFIYIKRMNYVYLSNTILSIKIIEKQLEKYSFTIVDTVQIENCKKALTKYKKIVHIRNNIFIKLAFRYSLEYYASYLIEKLNNLNSSNIVNKTNDKNDKNDKEKQEEYEQLINDIKQFISIICYYKETSNIKLYKQLNKICIEKILFSQNYKNRYYNLGIYSHIVDDNTENIELEKTNVFLNPHFIADYIKFVYFCYPKIKMNKQIYILLVDFFIFTTKEKDIWEPIELDEIWNKLIFLIYKYSNSRKNITFPEEEKNIFFIHCILERINNMNCEMNTLLNIINKYPLANDIAMKKYIDSVCYTHNKKYLMYMLLRHLKHPKLKDLFYKNAVKNKFINTLNESIFQFTPNILKKFFKVNVYGNKTQKYINYVANDHELYVIYNKIYEIIFQYDTEKRYINKTDDTSNLKFSMNKDSMFRNIIEEPMFFDFENINGIKHKKHTTYVYSILSFLDNYIEQLEKQKSVELNNINIDYPDEFLDPIMKTEITDPILLPNSNNIMDRSILEELLVYNNTNPFTQEELFLDDVLKYNETDEAKQILQTFIKQKEDYIKECSLNN